MAKPTVTMQAKKAKKYNGKFLVVGKPFQAKPGDVRLLQQLGWAEDAPAPVAPKVVTKPFAPAPVKSGTYHTADLKPKQ